MSFSVTVRDHIMIAHSFEGESFGPAQALHGATFIVDATFGAERLDDSGIVVDIGWAAAALSAIAGSLTYRNLDDDPQFAQVNTTTERLCQVVADRLADAVLAQQGNADQRLTSVTVTMHESHIAWASYSRPL